MRTFTDSLGESMAREGVSRETLARRLGLSASTLAEVESGRRKPTPELVQLISVALGVNIWELISGTSILKQSPEINAVLEKSTSASQPAKNDAQWRVYYSSGLTGLNAEERELLRDEIRVIDRVCAKLGADLCIPWKSSLPDDSSRMTPDAVYRLVRSEVSESDVMVLNCRVPFSGAGQELEIASSCDISAILTIPKGSIVSRMVLGSPTANQKVYFSSHQELKRRMVAELSAAFERLRIPKAAYKALFGMRTDTSVAQRIGFYSCFISYSHSDTEFACSLHEALRRHGIRCWLDEHELKPGDRILNVVNDAIRLHDKILLCCSEASLGSWWVKDEIRKAQERERKEDRDIIIPLMVDRYLLDGWEDGLAADLRSRLAADFTGWEHDSEKFEEQFDRVVRALRADENVRTMAAESKL